jgi:Protein of unknown function (DUF1304)
VSEALAGVFSPKVAQSSVPATVDHHRTPNAAQDDEPRAVAGYLLFLCFSASVRALRCNVGMIARRVGDHWDRFRQEGGMSWKPSQIALCSIGILHSLFMVGELYPWESPLIMAVVLKKWPAPLDLSPNDSHFVSMVVHNAGIYNGIVAVGLFVAASRGRDALPVQIALLAGGIAAGLFGAATLTGAIILQAVLGAIALALIVYKA